ncbi:MAG: GNAT family N-acetyltransferase [Lachnospiraceae bacterium]|nr:GNAT family N-acetyltransferase [Lachnospiraceae bacterium]
MIRKATKEDIPSIVKIYDAILDYEEAGKLHIGWARGVYPTEQTALDSLGKGTLFVCEDGGRIVASAKIDQTQVPEYRDASWKYDAPDHEIMVLHALAVDPAASRCSYGKTFVRFYEQYALEHNCHYLRMDTQEINKTAQSLYKKLGYREAGVVFCVFNGIPNVRLMCLEKKI